ncbi:MAG TPA: hypothetical protein VGL09_07645 [Methylomirabilota bacterium]
MNGKTLIAALVFWVIGLMPLPASADSVFSLDDKTLVTKSAVAVLTDEFFGGRTNALRILFTPETLTAQQQQERAREDWRLTKDYAVVVLFLDKSNRITQVNITVVIPGQTVVRTVAYKQPELQPFAAGYSYDGKRLKLRSEGSFTEATPGMAPIKLGWDMDVNAPVVDRLGAAKK